MEGIQLPRLNVTWPITVFVNGSTLSGVTKNITVKGMFIHCDEFLQVNENYRISLKPPVHRSIEMECKVDWSNDELRPSGSALYFVKVTGKDRNILKNIVSFYSKKSNAMKFSKKAS